ncbi:uncharacterized protein LOC115877946 [Sitophilus oryzae]|uniref:Uncharacterized protein LOC115877946 n=1 Tax=Sitophilus oryzae TaxID=7048 RepID=A0A6J2XGT6_SITOR|nr:uncharacterized protein LOC115877946 [Sitophilus oryzae]
MGRLYGSILKERVFEEIEEQGGLRAGRSCTDNIFVLQQIIEKRRARNLDTHLVFIDLEKAYDTVPLKKLFEILVETNEALKNWRRKSRAMGIEIDNHCLSTLFFADDQVIVAGCEEDADYMLRKLDEEYDRWGLNINLTKTEYLKVGEEQTEDPKLHIHEIKRCSEYKYLGSIISEEENSKKDIHSRVQQAKERRMASQWRWTFSEEYVAYQGWHTLEMRRSGKEQGEYIPAPTTSNRDSYYGMGT